MKLKGKSVDILLVEDDPHDVELALFVFEKNQIPGKVHVVRDGEEALEFLFCNGEFANRNFSEPPSVVFLDLKLPKIGGLEVLREIKKDARTRNIPVVVLTSSTEQKDVAEGYRLGVNSYVQKPVGFDAFQKLIMDLASYWLGVNHSAPSGAAAAG